MTKKEPVDRNVDVFYSINMCWHVFVYNTNTAPFLSNSFAIVPNIMEVLQSLLTQQ